MDLEYVSGGLGMVLVVVPMMLLDLSPNAHLMELCPAVGTDRKCLYELTLASSDALVLFLLLVLFLS